MSENEKKHETCCCCQSWKAIFIAIAFMVIGAVIGHVMTMGHHYGKMRGLCGYGYNKEARWDRDKKCEERFEHKFKGEKEGCGKRIEKSCSESKAKAGKCKPGCTCPKCSKKAPGLSDPNKANCPMKDKKEGKPKKD